VLDRPAPLRRLHDFVATYTYPDLFYLLICTVMVVLFDRDLLCNVFYKCLKITDEFIVQ